MSSGVFKLQTTFYRIQTSGVIKIAQSLHNTTLLTVFDVQSNNITEEAADDIATVLSQNVKVQKLWLGGNNLGTLGTIKIAESLENSTNLTILDIKFNNLPPFRKPPEILVEYGLNLKYLKDSATPLL